MAHTTGTLIICPTPLGNLGDVTKRSVEVLNTCDVIYCEDTRVTGKLLAALGIEKHLERLDENTLATRAEAVINRVLQGEVVVYCSDAGMPGVSDPGQRLVACAYDKQAPVEVLPGPTASITAYVASGFLTPSFYFGGFFPRKTSERTRMLESLDSLQAALIFYESPKRLVSALVDIAKAFPLRNMAVCRELTKLHEEVVRGSTQEVAEMLSQRSAQAPIRGEVVLVIDAPPKEEQEQHKRNQIQQATREAFHLLQKNHFSKREIIAHLKNVYNLSRNDAYELVQNVYRQQQEGDVHDEAR